MRASSAASARQPSVVLRYGVATAAAGLALLLTRLLLPALQEPVFALFFIAVLVSSWYGGLGPGLFTTALSALLAVYYVFPPIGQSIIAIDSVIRLGVEVAAALIISSLTAARRRLAATLDAQREQLQITLASIGDAVITTDQQGRVTFLNGVAQSLTGWSLADALGQDIAVVFPIINAETRQSVESPVTRVLRDGRMAGLANHTCLIATDGTERPIEDSGAPIRDRSGQLIGVILVFRDVTDRVKAEAALQASHNQLAVILQGIADGIVAELPEGRLAYANEAAAQVIGYPSVEAMLAVPSGDRLQRFVIMDEAGALLPASQLPGRLALQGAEQPSRVVRYQEVSTGQEHWALVQARPVRDSHGQVVMSIAIMHDITAQKQAEVERARLLAGAQAARAEAEAAKRRATLLAEASRLLAMSLDYPTTLSNVAQFVVPALADWCGVYLLDDHEQIQLLAAAHEDAAKIPLAHELHRRYPPALSAPGGAGAVLRTGQAELISDVSDDLLAAVAHDAEHLELLRTIGFVSFMMVPLTARGRTLAALAFVSSQPERRYGPEDVVFAEELAQRAAQAIDNAQLYRQAQQAVQLRDQFLSLAAHELKTPLTTLMGQAQLFRRRVERDGHLSERDRQTLEVINNQVARLSKMVLALLDSSRIEMGQLSLERAPIDICALVRRVVGEVQLTVDDRTIELHGSEAPIIVNGDDVRLEQVLQNLIQNALKYSVPPHPVIVTVLQQEDQVWIGVHDHGIGIPSAALPNLFQRFYRADNADESRISGMGIGLYVVKEIMTLHGGGVGVESTKGTGSIFTVWLPVVAGSDNCEPGAMAHQPRHAAQ
jgi:PAS domain S-box-containing protein